MTTPATSPQVSTVIPTRGRPELVLRAVRSALAQTLAPHEVIVVVDGPDPATCQALSSLREQRVRVIALETPVEERKHAMLEHARLPVTGSPCSTTTMSGYRQSLKDNWRLRRGSRTPTWLFASISSVPMMPKMTVRPRRLPRAGESISEFMFDYLCYFQTSSFVSKRSLFLEVPFQTGQAFFQDIDWFLRVNQRPETRLVIVAEPLTIYYEPGGG